MDNEIFYGIIKNILAERISKPSSIVDNSFTYVFTQNTEIPNIEKITISYQEGSLLFTKRDNLKINLSIRIDNTPYNVEPPVGPSFVNNPLGHPFYTPDAYTYFHMAKHSYEYNQLKQITLNYRDSELVDMFKLQYELSTIANKNEQLKFYKDAIKNTKLNT